MYSVKSNPWNFNEILQISLVPSTKFGKLRWKYILVGLAFLSSAVWSKHAVDPNAIMAKWLQVVLLQFCTTDGIYQMIDIDVFCCIHRGFYQGLECFWLFAMYHYCETEDYHVSHACWHCSYHTRMLYRQLTTMYLHHHERIYTLIYVWDQCTKYLYEFIWTSTDSPMHSTYYIILRFRPIATKIIWNVKKITL